MTKEEALYFIEDFVLGAEIFRPNVRGASLDLAIAALRESAEQPAIDDLPVEDVAMIQYWIEFLQMSPSVRFMTIRLSDGETLYTVKNERA